MGGAQPGPGDRDEVPPTEQPLLTIRRAAERLGVAYGTIRNAIEKEKLVGYKILGTYRIKPRDLDTFVENCRIRPSRPNSRPPAPRAKAGGSAFKNLDAERLLDAWRRQGVLADPPRARSARSSSSSRDPSTPPGSTDPDR